MLLSCLWILPWQDFVDHDYNVFCIINLNLKSSYEINAVAYDICHWNVVKLKYEHGNTQVKQTYLKILHIYSS